MTVQELIRHLEHFHPDQEVRIGYQPHYPIQAAIAGVVLAAPSDDDSEKVVYILEGSFSGYLNRGIWNEV